MYSYKVVVLLKGKATTVLYEENLSVLKCRVANYYVLLFYYYVVSGTIHIEVLTCIPY